ncbi:MAG: VWA domain-containing protein, partial [Campylobacterota bacterium]|nr:VWA domain-containing protein [Campylobacterota bacterium]
MQFLHPNVFYMMLIPLILLIVLVLTNKDGMKRYFSKDILDKLIVGGKSLDKNTRNGLFFITLILFIVALSRPVIDIKEQEIKQNLIPIVVALDVSKSMMATDIYPNRISLAKKKLKQIIKLSQNSTIGILLFAKDSFILSPVTEDFISLNYIIENLDTNLDFVNGSNIYAVLEGTSHMLSEFKVKNLIILSDGGNNKKYEKSLSFAKENEIVIYTIGIATNQGAPIPTESGYMTDKNGNIVTVKLNQSIKNLALKSGGGYIDFTLDNSDLQAIITQINSQSKKEELNNQKIKTYTELFYFPLALGLFVLLLALSSLPSFRKNKTFLVLIAISFISESSYGSFFEFNDIEEANKLYKDKNFTKAADIYRKLSTTPQSFYNLANSLYKDKKYQEAIDTYSKIITNNNHLEYQKLHNIANSYVMLNNLVKAKEFYEKALKLENDKQTKENLKLVNEALKKQNKKDKQDKQNKQNKNDKQDKQNKNDKQDKQNKQNQEEEKKEQQNKQNK